jgi:5-methylcytosine-specific restriction endonuclease McrA
VGVGFRDRAKFATEKRFPDRLPCFFLSGDFTGEITMAKDKRTYWEKLKDPRWQKMRLQVLERDEFQCTQCGDKESTLHVHHGCYRKGAEPWEYPLETLHTLCETCHEDVQSELAKIHERLAFLPAELLYSVCNLIDGFQSAWPFHFVVRDYDRCKREATESGWKNLPGAEPEDPKSIL